MGQDQRFYAPNRQAWRAWLEENHLSSSGVWLVYDKNPPEGVRFGYEDRVEEALCFGWVDSKPGKVDAARAMLYFAPRKAKSGWSKPNKLRVARLSEAGLMAPAGLAKVAAAQQDGSWSLLDAVETLTIPPDLEAAFERFPNSATHFDAFPRSVKRGILEWIVQAKRPETRAKRVEETARLAGQNVRANQWRDR